VTHLPAGSSAKDGYDLWVDPDSAGWGYSALRVLTLEPGGSRALPTGDSEWIVLPLAGACTVLVDGETFTLHGRADVFSGVTDFAYLPRDSRAVLSSSGGGRFALAGARCTRRLPARYGPASGVPVELRGAGGASRQVNNFAAADSFACDRLIAVEVLTRAATGPPSRRTNTTRTGTTNTARMSRAWRRSTTTSSAGGAAALGYQRSTPPRRPHRRTGRSPVRRRRVDPRRLHGPSMAVPGYDMYYLNVMAGPGPLRAWLISDDPAHAWVRDTWAAQPTDPRLPLYEAPDA